MLTARQQEIWQFLVEYADGHGYPPTVREIGEAVGLASPSTVHAHLANLERAGLLKRDPSKPRALDLIGHRPSRPSRLRRRSRRCRSCRCSARSRPARPCSPRRTSRTDCRAGAARPRRGLPAHGARRVDDRGGHSRRRHARRPQAGGCVNGDVVVALVGDDESANEATVKTFYRESGRIRLQPENSALEPIYADHVQVIGKVVGVFRSLR